MFNFYSFYGTIKIASDRRLFSIMINYNKLVIKILYILWSLGFINGFSFVNFTGNKIVIYLKYFKGRSVLRGIYPVSKPGKRVYIGYKSLLKLTTGICGIISTNKGIYTHQLCISIRKGGEFLCIVY